MYNVIYLTYYTTYCHGIGLEIMKTSVSDLKIVWAHGVS